jgi:hypothetical protein
MPTYTDIIVTGNIFHLSHFIIDTSVGTRLGTITRGVFELFRVVAAAHVFAADLSVK